MTGIGAAASLGSSPAHRTDVLGMALRWLLQHVRLITIYLGSLAALILALTTLRDRVEVLGGQPWLLAPVAVLPLAAAIAGEFVPAWLRRRRQNRIIHVVEEKPGYFRVGPYGATEDDRLRYKRADEAHKRVLAWLTHTDQTGLYLTGLSGTGKSSLLYAYVLPRLRDSSPPVRAVVVRSFKDPLEDLKTRLLKPGVVWQKPPADEEDPQAVLERAIDYLRPEKLLLVFDQFEEFLIIHERDQQRRRALAELLASVQKKRMAQLRILLVVRSEYLGALQELLPRAELPALQQDENWIEISPFLEHHARDFMMKSGLHAGKEVLDEILHEVTQIEEMVGLVRPITLNMVGLVLVRTASSEEQPWPRQRKSGRLILTYLRNCIERSDVRDHARHVLLPMITDAGTKQPKAVAELAQTTGLPSAAVTGCLLILGNDGLVRRIDEQENIWEISHDFVARLLTHVLATRRRTFYQAARRWFVPVALAVWVGVYLLWPAFAEEPWYRKIPLEQIRQPNRQGEYCLHVAARRTDGKAATEYFLRLGASMEVRDPDGETPLCVAADYGNTEVVKTLLEHGADIKARDEKGATPLHCAASSGYPEIAKLLIAQGANVEAKDKEGATPLHYAADRGRSDAVRILLEHGADVKARLEEDKATPLHWAAGRGHAELVQILLDYGAEIEAATKDGSAALHLAAERGHTETGRTETARVLLDRGANLKAKDTDGYTPLHRAAKAGHAAVVQLLLDRGAEVEAAAQKGLTPFHLAALGERLDVLQILLDHGADVDKESASGARALHSAAFAGSANTVKLLLDHSANIEARLKDRRTALHVAASTGMVAVVDLLLERKAKIEVQNNLGETPLHHAAVADHANVVDALLAHGANIEAPDNNKRTPLLAAAAAGSLAAAKRLIASKADIKARSSGSLTAVHEAAQAGHAEFVEFLLDQKADIEARTDVGSTPLHQAAYSGRANVVAALLKRKAAIEAKDDEGMTPLHDAARTGQLEVAEVLVAHHANIEATDNGGMTPLGYAAFSGHFKTTAYLLARNANVEAKRETGARPLHQAAIAGHADIAQLLLDGKADINAKTTRGDTPLHIAAGAGHLAVVELLLQRGAATGMRNKDGKTPLDLAQENKHKEVVNALREHTKQTSLGPGTPQPQDFWAGADRCSALAAEMANGANAPSAGPRARPLPA